MNEKEKIEELENQIKFLKNQVSALKSEFRIDWTKYYMFGDGEYHNGLCYSTTDGVTERIRGLAMRLLSLQEECNVHGDKYVHFEKCVRATKMTKEQAKFANGFIDEIYPIVEKYAMIALKNKELKGDTTK